MTKSDETRFGQISDDESIRSLSPLYLERYIVHLTLIYLLFISIEISLN